jgi:hypothetical protein
MRARPWKIIVLVLVTTNVGTYALCQEIVSDGALDANRSICVQSFGQANSSAPVGDFNVWGDEVHQIDEVKPTEIIDSNRQVPSLERKLDFCLADGSIIFFLVSDGSEYIRIVGPNEPGGETAGVVQKCREDENGNLTYERTLTLDQLEELVKKLSETRTDSDSQPENAFFAAALMHAGKRNSIKIWGVKAVNKLRSGNWTNLFWPQQNEPQRTRKN